MALGVREAWEQLPGAPPLRGNRGCAYWRGDTNYDVQLFPGARWTWRDWATDEFGDTADLVRKVLHCSYPEALTFLGESQPVRCVQRTQDSENARLWRRGLFHAIEQEIAEAKPKLAVLFGLPHLTPSQMREKYRLAKLVGDGTRQIECFSVLRGGPLEEKYRDAKNWYAELTSDLLKLGAELEQADRELKNAAKEFVAEVMGV